MLYREYNTLKVTVGARVRARVRAMARVRVRVRVVPELVVRQAPLPSVG